MTGNRMFNFGIKGKLLLLVGGMLGIFLVATIFAVFKVIDLKDQVEFLGLERIPLSETLADMQTSSHAMARYSWLAIEAENGSEMEKSATEKIDHYADLLVTSTEKYATFNLSPEGRALIDQAIPVAKNLRENIFAVKKKLLIGTTEGDLQAKKMMLTTIPPVGAKLTEIFDSIDKRQAIRNAEVIKIAQEKAKSAQVNLIVMCAVTTLFSILFAYIFVMNLVKSLTMITDQVGDASSQVSSASEQLSSSAEQLSSSAQEQAAAVEEASASLTEISGMIEANVRNSEESNKLTGEVYRSSEETKELMSELSSAMDKILESNVKIEKLVKVIEEIGSKTEVIDDIVFKTQLLSFNASVEAERAGEHGRGFAVVAQEVGNLAQMSGKAANDISSIVKVSIKEAEEISEENKKRVENGGKLASTANKKMIEVMEKVSAIQTATIKVVEASREQSQGINQISASVESINQSTQETASTSEESASASEELSGQSDALLGLVQELRVIITGEAEQVQVKNYRKEAVKNNIVPMTGKARLNKKIPSKKSPVKLAVSNNDFESSDELWEKI